MPEMIRKTGKARTNYRAKLQASFKLFKKLAGIAAGAALIAVSFNAFVLPYGLLAGGVSGLAIMGNYLC